jgi:hypothetical protein
MKKSTRVSFGNVEIREYDVVLSNNPACGIGPSVELGWEYQLGTSSKVNDYERKKGNRRRNTRELYMSQYYRESLLYETTDKADIQKAIQEKNRARRRIGISNRLRSPIALIQKNIRSIKREKKIGRAVRNLQRKKAGNILTDKVPSGDPDSILTSEEIYKGWWLPLSRYMF